MRCGQCQHDIPSGATFCPTCGAKPGPGCPRCRAPNVPDDNFCRNCGQALAGGTDRAASAGTRFASPDAYTPKHLAERILLSRGALEGERKQVTVLFADLKGSMELLADRDPEEAREFLDAVLELMMEAVHEYDGTVNQVMGDGVMALFGAPVACEDHAVRACYAALRMQEWVKRYAEEAQRKAGVPIQIRVGLNSGEVVVRSITNDLHMDYTAVGHTTHLAARMEQMAMAGSILMSTETLRLAEGFVQVKPLGAVAVKGLAEPVEAHELVGAGAARTRLQVSLTRGLSRFVGRAAEMETLQRAAEAAWSGHGQVVGVVGEPGVGKSRLFWEFTHSPHAHGWLVLYSGSVSYGRATPYLPVIDLLKAYFRVQDRDAHRGLREKVVGTLLGLDPSLAPTLPALLALLDVPGTDPEWVALEPAQRRQRTLEAVKRLLLRESQAQPLIVIVEDLHWIDGETQRLLDSLIESLPGARLLLLVNWRPEYRHGWDAKSYYSQLRLDALPARNAGELLRALLGEDAGLEPLRGMLIERTGGNPFFLEESVRTLEETRVLVGERGAYRIARPIETIPAPTSVQATLAARIDRLAPEDKRLLQCAAVIGNDVPLLLLQAIIQEDDEAVRGALSHLQAAEFLYESRLFPDVEYTFKHALTHEVAYRSLLQERRHTLHARIVNAIEQLYADRLGEHIERLAHHAFRGEVWDKALPYLRQAGMKAFNRSAHREAATWLKQGLAALSHLPESKETLEHAIDLRLELRHTSSPLGEPDRGLRYLREAEDLARRLDDRGRLGWVSAYICYSLFPSQPAEGLRFGENARDIAETLGDAPLQVTANYYVGMAYENAGDYRRAGESFRKAMRLLEGELGESRCGLVGYPVAVCRAWLAWSLANLGAFDEGIAHGMEGLRRAEALDHPYSLIITCRDLAAVYSLQGALAPAAHLLERALKLVRQWHVTDLAPMVMGRLGHVYALAGRTSDGLALLRDAVALSGSTGRRGAHALLVTYLGEACVVAGRLPEAAACAGEALAHARACGERGHEAYALHLLGEVSSQTDPRNVEAAAGHLARAMAGADELGMRPLIARCHLALGTLDKAPGQRDGSEEHLGTAIAQLRDMGMKPWLERAMAARER
jgi:class 3 adenylate cyclase/tetratricopeptide (TPR) repeat protein